MPETIQERITAALTGFAMGESLSWSTPVNRSQFMPAWLNRIRTDMEKDGYHKHLTSVPVPFSLNQNPNQLRPGAADLTEWMAWTGTLLIQHDGMLNTAFLESAWKSLAAKKDVIHSRISIHAALKNMQKGLTAPESGRFNPHYFDDAVLPRALVIGAVHTTKSNMASAQAALDASFTHFEEGVFSARALANAISCACHGCKMSHILDEALKELPPGSLAWRTVHHALECADKAGKSPVKLALLLSREICRPEYSYGNIAHEILACALAVIHLTSGDFDKTLSASSLVPRAGAGLMAVSGALAASISGLSGENWINEDILTLRGDFVPPVKGISLITLAEQLADLAKR